MLKVLLKKQMQEIFRSYVYDAKKNKARTKATTVAFIVMYALLMIVILGGMFTLLSYMLCETAVSMNMGWLYFILMGMIAIFLGAFGSIFSTYSALYLSKDNDLLLSLPISVHNIVTARLLGVYLMGLMYSGVVMLPAIIVYLIFAPFSVTALIGSIVIFVAVSIIVLVLSCLLGWVVAKISLKLKNKSFATVLSSLIFIAVYYFIYFKAQEVLEHLLENMIVYGEKIKGYAYPLYVFGRAGEGSIAAILAVVLVVILLFVLMWSILSHSFIKIATATGKTSKAVYRKAKLKRNTAFKAIVSKEFARFTSSPNYMLNCGMGTLFLPIVGILLLIKGNELIPILQALLESMDGSIPVLMCTAICLAASMNDMVAPSVSLEGKNLWLLQSLPISAKKILRAKLVPQLIITGIPMLFCAICAMLCFEASLVEMTLFILTLIAYLIFSAEFGLFIGLKLPNINWTNEIVPIKQSACIAVSLLTNWVYAILLGVGYIIIGYKLGTVLYLTLFILLTAVASYLIDKWISDNGARRFALL